MRGHFKKLDQIGPGGYKCRCCGPSPKDRAKWRRVRRARLKEEARKEVENGEELV